MDMVGRQEGSCGAEGGTACLEDRCQGWDRMSRDSSCELVSWPRGHQAGDSKSSVYEGDCGRPEDKCGCLRSYSSSPGLVHVLCGWSPEAVAIQVRVQTDDRDQRRESIRSGPAGWACTVGLAEARRASVQVINLVSITLNELTNPLLGLSHRCSACKSFLMSRAQGWSPVCKSIHFTKHCPGPIFCDNQLADELLSETLSAQNCFWNVLSHNQTHCMQWTQD